MHTKLETLPWDLILIEPEDKKDGGIEEMAQISSMWVLSPVAVSFP